MVKALVELLSLIIVWSTLLLFGVGFINVLFLQAPIPAAACFLGALAGYFISKP